MIELRTEIAQQMVAQLGALGDGDLAIADAAGTPVAFTGEWPPGLVQRFSLEVKLARRVREAALDGSSAPRERDPGGVCLVGLPLVYGNQTIGTLVIRGDRERARAAMRYLEALADLLGRQLAAVDPVEQPDEWRSNLLERLHQADPAESLDTLAGEAEALGIDLTIPRAALVLQIGLPSGEAEDVGATHPAKGPRPHGQRDIVRAIERACSPSHHAIVGHLGDGCIAVLHGVDPSTHEQQLKQVARNLLAVVDPSRNTARAGIGGYWPGVNGLARSCREALQALKTGTRLRVGGPVYTLTDVSVGVFLGDADRATKIALARRLLDGLDDDLVATVRAMLDADLSVSGAARKLYLHRHTMLYRLEKLRQLTGRDARRFWDVLPLAMALNLLRLTDADTITS